MTGTTETLLFLLLDLAVIIVAARSFGALARKLGQPVVIGEIVAGIILGPTVLGRIFPQLPPALFRPEVPLRQLADLGLVFFMFLVGLELDPQLIRKEARRALAISLSGVVAPFALGALIAIPLLPLNNGGVFADGVTTRPTAVAFSLFMGAAMCITAFPVLARILIDRGLYKSRLGTSALCAAAVDDVTAWILLAAIVGISRHGSAGAALTAFGLTVLFAVFMVTVGRRLLALFARRCERTGRLTVDQVAVIVVGLLLSAYVTERIGIHSIFGAFVFGAIMPHHSRMTRDLTDRIEDFTVVVLLPAFFTVAGLRTNLFTIDSVDRVLWTLLIVGAAIVGKLAGCGVAARLNGYSTTDAFAIGTLMNTRGLTELVILSVGLSIGVLSDRTFAMMVVMALVTTFMAAPIMNWIMPRREMVRLLAGGDPEQKARRVLVAMGNPENALALVGAGIALTSSESRSELLLVRLVPTARAPEFRSGLKDEESQVDRSVEAMSEFLEQTAAAGVATRTASFLSDDVGQDLAYLAGTQDCDVILLGWHRPSLERGVIRALIHRLFEIAPCDVAVFIDRRGGGVRAGGDRPILIASPSPEATEAVMQIGGWMADSLGTEIRAIQLSAVSGDSGSHPMNRGPVITDATAVDAAVRESARAAAAVVSVGSLANAGGDFGQPADTFAALADCPVLAVHSRLRTAEPDAGVSAGRPRRVSTIATS